MRRGCCLYREDGQFSAARPRILTSRPGACLIVRCVPLLRAGEGPLAGYGALLLKVGLVADNDDGYVLVVLDASDFLTQHFDLVHGGGRGDAEDENEALTGLHVKVSHGHYEPVIMSDPYSSMVRAIMGGGRPKTNTENIIPNCSVPAVSRLKVTSMVRMTPQASMAPSARLLTFPRRPIFPVRNVSNALSFVTGEGSEGRRGRCAGGVDVGLLTSTWSCVLYVSSIVGS